MDALQWPGHWTQEFQDFAGKFLIPTEPRDGIGVVGYLISTLKGKQWLHKGDWVIRKNDIFVHNDPYTFEQNYEKVEE